MARLQILELPMVHNGDQAETPFVLVIDEWSSPPEGDASHFNEIADKIGARYILAFDTTVDIPANNVTAPVDDGFKAEVQQWAAGTNETLARIIEAFSVRKRRRHGEPRPEAWAGRPAHPDGTPYRYSEITSGGWEPCDGCRTWGQWTAEDPHDCPGTYSKGPITDPTTDV